MPFVVSMVHLTVGQKRCLNLAFIKAVTCSNTVVFFIFLSYMLNAWVKSFCLGLEELFLQYV